MAESFRAADPVLQALIATLGTYLLTAMGTLPVLLFHTAPRRLMDAMMGGAAGVMTAASCWSLLVPAISMGGVGPAVGGLIAGGGFIYVADQLLPHLHSEFPEEATAEGPRVAWQRSTLLMLAITLHNFPEVLPSASALAAERLVRRPRWRLASGFRTCPKVSLSPYRCGAAG